MVPHFICVATKTSSDRGRYVSPRSKLSGLHVPRGPARPACCRPSDTLDQVAKLMRDHHCGEIPVCDGAKLLGVITDRDITCRAVAAGKAPAEVPASEIMTKHLFTIRQDAKVGEALAMMEQKLLRRLPVLSRDGILVGIISQADLIAKAPALQVAWAMKNARKTRRPIANA